MSLFYTFLKLLQEVIIKVIKNFIAKWREKKIHEMVYMFEHLLCDLLLEIDKWLQNAYHGWIFPSLRFDVDLLITKKHRHFVNHVRYRINYSFIWCSFFDRMRINRVRAKNKWMGWKEERTRKRWNATKVWQIVSPWWKTWLFTS